MSEEIPSTVVIAWRDAIEATIRQERERCIRIIEACYFGQLIEDAIRKIRSGE